jgi:hypothetical protein
MFQPINVYLVDSYVWVRHTMRLELTLRDGYRLLSPVGCPVEALSMALLLVAILGCAVSAL